jgi:hypothetical protein
MATGEGPANPTSGGCICGRPGCRGGGSGGVVRTIKPPSFWSLMLRTFTFEWGRRMVEWSVPGAQVVYIPPMSTGGAGSDKPVAKESNTPGNDVPGQGGYH